MHKTVAVMGGDGIGPEVTRQAAKVLKSAAASAGIQVTLEELPVGGAAYDLAGSPLPDETLARARAADAVLLGAVGGAKWEQLDFALRPERGILKLRKELALFANLRPAKVYGDLVDASTLKREVVEGCDLMVIRELTGGLYFGQPRGVSGDRGHRVGINTLVYSEEEIERILRTGFEVAGKRRRQLCSVDKFNVLETMVLWREVADRLAPEYPDVKLSHMLVDNAAMQLIRAPLSFDTLVTGNLFGDILSDEASMLTGSIGMLPSASIGTKHALYEPVHGSAPDIAGKDLANPLAAILSVGMMFRYSFDRPEVEQAIEAAVTAVIRRHRTPDIHTAGTERVGCERMGDLVLEELGARLAERLKASPLPAAGA